MNDYGTNDGMEQSACGGVKRCKNRYHLISLRTLRQNKKGLGGGTIGVYADERGELASGRKSIGILIRGGRLQKKRGTMLPFVREVKTKIEVKRRPRKCCGSRRAERRRLVTDTGSTCEACLGGGWYAIR